MSNLLTFNWPEEAQSQDGLSSWGTVADYCAKFPQHPICSFMNEQSSAHGGHSGGGGGGGHHHGRNRGGGNDGDDDGGNLGWYPFS
jgi:hypothetical protein